MRRVGEHRGVKMVSGTGNGVAVSSTGNSGEDLRDKDGDLRIGCVEYR